MALSAACALLLALTPAQSQTSNAAAAADALVAAVLEARAGSGFSVRVGLTRSVSATGRQEVRQLLIKGRHDGTRASLLLQQVWPDEGDGPAIVLEDAGRHQLAGFRHHAGTVTRLSAAMYEEPVFGSDITLEDAAQTFWFWRSRRIVGEEAIGEYQCTIVELRPDAGTPTSYARVRAWVSPELALPLRIEQFAADGRLIKRIGLFRILKVKERWIPALVTIEPAHGRSRTVLEGLQVESDVRPSARDFTVDGLIQSRRSPD